MKPTYWNDNPSYKNNKYVVKKINHVVKLILFLIICIFANTKFNKR